MQSVPTTNLIEGKRAGTLVTKGPQSELCATGPFAVDHFFGYPVPVEKHVEIIALDIHANEIQQYEQHRWRFPVIVIVVKDISIVASDNPIRGTDQ